MLLILLRFYLLRKSSKEAKMKWTKDKINRDAKQLSHHFLIWDVRGLILCGSKSDLKPCRSKDVDQGVQWHTVLNDKLETKLNKFEVTRNGRNRPVVHVFTFEVEVDNDTLIFSRCCEYWKTTRLTNSSWLEAYNHLYINRRDEIAISYRKHDVGKANGRLVAKCEVCTP